MTAPRDPLAEAALALLDEMDAEVAGDQHPLADHYRRQAVDRLRAALAPRPPETADHPDDGHKHSLGCRICGVDAPLAVYLPPEKLSPETADPLRAAVVADPWSFHRGPLRERLEWCRMQHQVGADDRYPTPPKTPEENARWHQDCADWYAEMVAQLDAITSPETADAGALDAAPLCGVPCRNEPGHPGDHWSPILSDESVPVLVPVCRDENPAGHVPRQGVVTDSSRLGFILACAVGVGAGLILSGLIR